MRSTWCHSSISATPFVSVDRIWQCFHRCNQKWSAHIYRVKLKVRHSYCVAALPREMRASAVLWELALLFYRSEKDVTVIRTGCCLCTYVANLYQAVEILNLWGRVHTAVHRLRWNFAWLRGPMCRAARPCQVSHESGHRVAPVRQKCWFSAPE